MKYILIIILLFTSFSTYGLDIHIAASERSKIYSSGRISRYLEIDSGKVIGFRVFEVKNEGLYSQMGLNIGDIIVGLNNVYFPELTLSNFDKILKESDALLLHVRKKYYFITIVKNIKIQFIYEG